MAEKKQTKQIMINAFRMPSHIANDMVTPNRFLAVFLIIPRFRHFSSDF